MVRTQVQLTEDQHRRLKRMAAERGVSMAEVIREGVEGVLSRSAEAERQAAAVRSLEFVGMCSSGKTDIAERHDEYLAKIYAEEDEKE